MLALPHRIIVAWLLPSLVFPLIEFLIAMTKAVLAVKLPLGACVLTASEAGLTGVALRTAAASGSPTRSREAQEPTVAGTAGALLAEARRQLEAYFAGELRRFDLPLDLSGRTEFQRRVLQACGEVPYGETVSYGELARRSGHPGAARAVGQVMATNPLALVVPCHRVVGSNGQLTGYGYGLACKAHLLDMERQGKGWAGVV